MAFLDVPPLGFAHRGGAADGDENTAAAFERTIRLGFRYVETDVHATADGVPVVFHDATLARMAGRAARIDALTWADLATVRIGGSAAVPRLDEVLDAWPHIRFNIDVKADRAVEPVLAAIRRAGATDRVLLASFDDRRLTRLRRLAGPAVATSLGVRAVARLRAASLIPGWTPGRPTRSPSAPHIPGWTPGRPTPFPSASHIPGWTPGRPRRLRAASNIPRRPGSAVAAQVPVGLGPVRIVDRPFLRRAHRLGLQVHVWTIDDPAEMNRLLDLGVDGLMTDRPEVLRDVLAARGHWPPPAR